MALAPRKALLDIKNTNDGIVRRQIHDKTIIKQPNVALHKKIQNTSYINPSVSSSKRIKVFEDETYKENDLNIQNKKLVQLVSDLRKELAVSLKREKEYKNNVVKTIPVFTEDTIKEDNNVSSIEKEKQIKMVEELQQKLIDTSYSLEREVAQRKLVESFLVEQTKTVKMLESENTRLELLYEVALGDLKIMEEELVTLKKSDTVSSSVEMYKSWWNNTFT